MTLSRDVLHQLPKAELHVHLDGCLRPATMLELADAAAVDLPATTADALARAMYGGNAGDLEGYLERYRLTLAVMQTSAALERIAYEFVTDLAAEHVRYVEARFCPALHEPSMAGEEAIEAVLAGFERASRDTGVRTGLIVCALRTLAPTVSERLADMAVEYQDAGVVGFDLGGAERGFPAGVHAPAFAIAARHDLGLTCHAGEADGPASMRDALTACGAQRLGHGTRLQEDAALEEEVRARGIPLEMCVSSNVHTGAVPDVASHPLGRYLDRGIIVTLNTDSRLIDGTTLTDEYALAQSTFDLSRESMERLILNAFDSAFLPGPDREGLVSSVRRALRAIP